MLARLPADAEDVISRGIWIVSVATSLFVLLSFVLFATDEFSGASKHTQAVVVDQGFNVPKTVTTKPAQPRKFIDEVAGKLRSPFDAIADTATSAWVREIVPTALALLVYGFGLGYLARYSAGRA